MDPKCVLMSQGKKQTGPKGQTGGKNGSNTAFNFFG
jgi:hypothetical protein